MIEEFVFGVKDLDRLLPGAIFPSSVIVVAGHPGAGKTTLASTICYANALRGYKCLYVTFQEHKEKMFRVMKSLGMDFYELEAKGLYTFLRIPVIKSVEDSVEAINSAVSSMKPKVVVVDSVNAMLMAAKTPDKRAWLQNYFYNLADVVRGVIVLVAEVPFDERKLNLGSVEFIVDTVIILKNRVEKGLLTRSMEIRKARGSPISLAEIPFTISAGRGIEVYIPPILSELGRPGEELKPPCTLLDPVLGHLHKGHSVYLEYPPDFRLPEATPCILGIAFRNNLKAVVISYLYPPETMYDLTLRAFSVYCEDYEKAVEAVNKNIVFHSINPFRYSLAEIIAEELRFIRESKAGVVIFHSVEIPAMAEKGNPNYLSSLYNQLNMLKQEQKIVVRIGSRVSDEVSNIFYSLSDVVIKAIPENNYSDYKVYIWRRGLRPTILSSKDLQKCCEEIALQYICSRVQT